MYLPKDAASKITESIVDPDNDKGAADPDMDSDSMLGHAVLKAFESKDPKAVGQSLRDFFSITQNSPAQSDDESNED